jgi:alkylhydroperoxidase family enzyme
VSGDEQQLAGVPLIETSQMPSVLRERLQPRIDRLGYLGGFFRLAAHQPGALAAFIDFTEASRSALPADLAEVVALTIATHTRNDYERNQHERLGVTLGLGADWVQAVARLDPEQEVLTPAQRAAQRWVVAGLNDHGHGSQTALRSLVDELGPALAVAVVLLSGRYIAHALLVNSFGVRPPVPSVFGDPGTISLPAESAAGSSPANGLKDNVHGHSRDGQ